MSVARLGDAIAALTAAFQASPALAGVLITTGISTTSQAAPEFIAVGHDGTLVAGSLAEVTEAGMFVTAFIAQGSPPLQEETGTVNVIAVSQTGDTSDLAGRITDAQRLLGACDDACTDLKTSGIVFDSADSGRLITRQAQGCAAIIAFTVGYTVPW
jgi:hypothetical protein